MKNYIKGRLRSFSYAFNGIRILFKEERNTRIYVVITVAVLLLSYFLRISHYEWIIVCSIIGLVFAMEAINAAIENLADYASDKEIHSLIKKVKDLSAAGVLLIALIALIIAFIIFIPKLLTLFPF
ncbi:MAG: diacylglycerol kinase family protein [Dysgonamonadaceae bacterium]|nr:diacylglycerol kinase family protein [Dysgonamonadaceae bacterium]MDD3728228.1 diacylglycerol kinase family protein [Dysgonamonadaceae bacterium]MDD4247232.1 diacylglycerol kinase family protein [Dysgonamonadaceae bacterium]